MTPSAFIFLYELQLFLTFQNRLVAVWNFRGELVTSFEDHQLWHLDCNMSNICITSDLDLLIPMIHRQKKMVSIILFKHIPQLFISVPIALN
jgi:hypothetical protein